MSKLERGSAFGNESGTKSKSSTTVGSFDNFDTLFRGSEGNGFPGRAHPEKSAETEVSSGLTEEAVTFSPDSSEEETVFSSEETEGTGFSSV